MSPVSIDRFQRVIDTLREFYARDGRPHSLNETQLRGYLIGLSGYSIEAVEAAAQRAIVECRFFPTLAELLAMLNGTGEEQAMAAFSRLRQAMRTVGAYRAIVFEDGALGDAIRLTFGGWPQACAYDYDSPAALVRRKEFLMLYAASVNRGAAETPLRLDGQQRGSAAFVPRLGTMGGPVPDDVRARLTDGDAAAGKAALGRFEALMRARGDAPGQRQLGRAAGDPR